MYRHFMKPAQVGEAFGASTTDVAAVVDFLNSQGMKARLIAQDRMAILATGTLAQAERAFQTRVRLYRGPDPVGKSFEFMANSTPIVVPAQLAKVVLCIGGLDNYARPMPRTTLTPLLARDLYGAQTAFRTGFLGQGIRLGISNWDYFSLDDAKSFIAANQLPVPGAGPGTNIQVKVVDQGHDQATPGVEGNVDIQMELAAAPLADIYIYDNLRTVDADWSTCDVLGVLTQEADDNVCDVISESYGWFRSFFSDGYFTSCHDQHLAMTAQGQTYLAASGDHGAAGIVDQLYPDIDPEVTDVGGTQATVDPNTGARLSEVGWPSSGGGWVNDDLGFDVLPNWQRGIGVPTSVDHRLVPDLALQSWSDGDAAYSYYLAGNPSTVAGTSCASPLCAGCLAALEQRLIASGFAGPFGGSRCGRINDLIYSWNGRPDAFYDVTSGSNGSLPDGTTSSAGPKWDFVTGWGAPNFDGWFKAITLAGQWTIVNLDPAGSAQSYAYGVNGAEEGGWANVDGSNHASLWSGTAASWVDLSPAGSLNSHVYGVGDGLQAGDVQLSIGDHASLWNGTASSWVDLNPVGASQSQAYGVGGNQEVGYSLMADGASHASRWTGTAASWVDLSPPGTTQSQIWGTDGTQQGGLATVNGMGHASLWSGTAVSWVDLNPAGASQSQVYGVGSGHQVGVAELGDGSGHASLWSGSAGSWVDLSPNGAVLSFAQGASGGQQAGSDMFADGNYRAALWGGGADSWTDLQAFLPPEFTSSSATSIWSDGSHTYVAGFGFNSAVGHEQALIWVGPADLRSVSGTVALQNYSRSPAGTAITVQLYLAGTMHLIDTESAALDASGGFTLSTTAPAGNYDVYVKASHWLRRKSVNQVLTGTVLSGLTFSLVNGDINGDNTISLADFGRLKQAYGSTPNDSNWNPNADLDGNGSVGLSDFGILKLHFGQSGD